MRNTCAMVGLHRPVSRPPRRAPKPGRASRTRIVDHPANYKRVKHLELSSPSDMHQEHSPDVQRRWHSSLRILLPAACVFVAVSSIEALGYPSSSCHQLPHHQFLPPPLPPKMAHAAATLAAAVLASICSVSPSTAAANAFIAACETAAATVATTLCNRSCRASPLRTGTTEQRRRGCWGLRPHD